MNSWNELTDVPRYTPSPAFGDVAPATVTTDVPVHKQPGKVKHEDKETHPTLPSVLSIASLLEEIRAPKVRLRKAQNHQKKVDPFRQSMYAVKDIRVALKAAIAKQRIAMFSPRTEEEGDAELEDDF